MEELKIKAPAKINLHLEVLRKRDDGYHDISSIFTLIDLYDSLIFKKSFSCRHAFRQLTNDVNHGLEDWVVMVGATVPDR